YMHVQPIFRHIDTDKDRVHLNPSLRNRASAAARATVRVRWNDGRIPVLRNGLMGPRTRRSSVRHRVGQISRSGAIRLTRMRRREVGIRSRSVLAAIDQRALLDPRHHLAKLGTDLLDRMLGELGA